MKLLYKELQEAEQSLLKVLQNATDPKLAYRMRKQANKIIGALKEIGKYHRGLLEKYGEKKDNHITVPDSKHKEFDEEMNVFFDLELDLDVQLIPWECVEQSGVKLSAVDLLNLVKFIDIPEKMKV